MLNPDQLICVGIGQYDDYIEHVVIVPENLTKEEFIELYNKEAKKRSEKKEFFKEIHNDLIHMKKYQEACDTVSKYRKFQTNSGFVNLTSTQVVEYKKASTLLKDHQKAEDELIDILGSRDIYAEDIIENLGGKILNNMLTRVFENYDKGQILE